MSKIVITDSSCLIGLSIIIPEAVYYEVVIRGEGRAGAEQVKNADWKARQTAEELELSVIGTIAILQKAVEKGIIEDLPVILENLRHAGFRFLL